MTATTQLQDLGAGRRWRRALVYGLGESGRAAAELLLGRGVAVVGVDARPAAELGLGAPLTAAGADFALRPEDAGLPAVDGVVLSPGVPPGRPLLAAARDAGVPVISELELAFPLLDGPVVAITGSNGKSTTTALTGAMLSAAGHAVEVCGNIGRAVSRRVDGPPGRTFVIEASSYQLEAVETFRPRAGAYLNLSPDHLDRYPSLDAYGAAKEALFERQGSGDTAVLNADDPRVAAVVTRSRRRWFSRRRTVSDGCHLEGDRVMEVTPQGGAQLLFERSDVPLAGAHNLENAMAAALLARALGAGAEAVRRGLRGFRGLPHRMEKVAEAAGVTWYDDSKGTNFAATAMSLADLPDGAVHLILGGEAKGDDPASVADLVAAKAKRLYLVGAAEERFAAAFAGVAPVERCGTLERAVAAAAQRAGAGDVVLLSPACASFDQFRDFAHRGEVFQRLVAAAVAGKGGG